MANSSLLLSVSEPEPGPSPGLGKISNNSRVLDLNAMLLAEIVVLSESVEGGVKSCNLEAH